MTAHNTSNGTYFAKYTDIPRYLFRLHSQSTFDHAQLHYELPGDNCNAVDTKQGGYGNYAETECPPIRDSSSSGLTISGSSSKELILLYSSLLETIRRAECPPRPVVQALSELEPEQIFVIDTAVLQNSLYSFVGPAWDMEPAGRTNHRNVNQFLVAGRIEVAAVVGCVEWSALRKVMVESPGLGLNVVGGDQWKSNVCLREMLFPSGDWYLQSSADHDWAKRDCVLAAIEIGKTLCAGNVVLPVVVMILCWKARMWDQRALFGVLDVLYQQKVDLESGLAAYQTTVQKQPALRPNCFELRAYENVIGMLARKYREWKKKWEAVNASSEDRTDEDGLTIAMDAIHVSQTPISPVGSREPSRSTAVPWDNSKAAGRTRQGTVEDELPMAMQAMRVNVDRPLAESEGKPEPSPPSKRAVGPLAVGPLAVGSDRKNGGEEAYTVRIPISLPENEVHPVENSARNKIALASVPDVLADSRGNIRVNENNKDEPEVKGRPAVGKVAIISAALITTKQTPTLPRQHSAPQH